MILTDAYPPPGIGGAPQIAYYQAKAFKDIGWEVGVGLMARVAYVKSPLEADFVNAPIS